MTNESILPPKVLIASQRKAGTYLYGEILQNLGLEMTHLHLERNKLQAYDPFLLQEGRDEPRRFDCRIPLEDSRKLVRHGQFAVSHLIPNDGIANLLTSFKIIAPIRELRAATISFCRWILSTGPGRYPDIKAILQSGGLPEFLNTVGEKYFALAVSIKGWAAHGNAMVVRYEDLKANTEDQLGSIAKFIGLKAGNDLEKTFRNSLNSNSLTKSTGFRHIQWCDESEKIFQNINGIESNEILGYKNNVYSSL